MKYLLLLLLPFMNFSINWSAFRSRQKNEETVTDQVIEVLAKSRTFFRRSDDWKQNLPKSEILNEDIVRTSLYASEENPHAKFKIIQGKCPNLLIFSVITSLKTEELADQEVTPENSITSEDDNCTKCEKEIKYFYNKSKLVKQTILKCVTEMPKDQLLERLKKLDESADQK